MPRGKTIRLDTVPATSNSIGNTDYSTTHKLVDSYLTTIAAFRLGDCSRFLPLKITTKRQDHSMTGHHMPGSQQGLKLSKIPV